MSDDGSIDEMYTDDMRKQMEAKDEQIRKLRETLDKIATSLEKDAKEYIILAENCEFEARKTEATAKDIRKVLKETEPK